MTCTSCLLVLFSFVWQPAAHAQAQATEPELKAAIIANMLLFVEWPVENISASEQLTICFLEGSPVATSLSQLDGKSVKGKPLRVSQISPEKASSCHALYLSPTSTPSLSRIVGTLGNAPVLLIGDTPSFLQRGIMVNLELVSGRMVFDIDLKSLQAAGLKLSSKALRLARLVID